MRWIKPEIGSTRIVKKFLIFPKTINEDTRWLETVYYRQAYVYDTRACQGDNLWWADMEWVDD